MSKRRNISDVESEVADIARAIDAHNGEISKLTDLKKELMTEIFQIRRDSSLRSQILKLASAYDFVTVSFLDENIHSATRNAISIALPRLVKEGRLSRLERGKYVYVEEGK